MHDHAYSFLTSTGIHNVLLTPWAKLNWTIPIMRGTMCPTFKKSQYGPFSTLSRTKSTFNSLLI